MKLVFPTPAYKEKAIEYIQEFIEYGSEVNGSGALDDFLRTEGGHISYGVRPTERGKHYATDMLAQALKVYDRLGIKNVLVTCDKENPASAKVIQNNGGMLEAEFYSETYDETLQRYVIKR